MNKNVREISLLGIFAALYVALCFASIPLSFGVFQFRIAEILVVLPFYNKKYCASIILGTFIANLFGPIGIVDAVVGSAASAVVCLIIVVVKKKAVIPPAAAVINGIIIGAMLHALEIMPDMGIIAIMAAVAIGVFAVTLIGVILFAGLEKKSPRFIEMIRTMSANPSNL